MSRIRSPGVSTASKMSQDVVSAAHGFRPSHSAQSYGLSVCFHSAGRVALCSFPDFGLVEPLLREGVPCRHLIVSSDLADAKVVVCEDFVATLLLDLVMAPAG